MSMGSLPYVGGGGGTLRGGEIGGMMLIFGLLDGLEVEDLVDVMENELRNNWLIDFEKKIEANVGEQPLNAVGLAFSDEMIWISTSKAFSFAFAILVIFIPLERFSFIGGCLQNIPRYFDKILEVSQGLAYSCFTIVRLELSSSLDLFIL
ncbi:hypothetical protein Tco_0693244 [Tanacetum coccineum]